jgi:hypothetical protein
MMTNQIKDKNSKSLSFVLSFIVFLFSSPLGEIKQYTYSFQTTKAGVESIPALVRSNPRPLPPETNSKLRRTLGCQKNLRHLMINSLHLLIPFILQMICIAADEFYFHRRRWLPRWERLGHPLDTLSMLACLIWLLTAPLSALSASAYIGLSLFSCLFVTKDEPVHNKRCSPHEQWLHALLFILHPLVLLSAGLLWPAWRRQTLSFIHYTGFEREFLVGYTILTLFFGIYQLIYWNVIWPSATSQKQAR